MRSIPTICVIAEPVGPIGIGGIMGGESTGSSETTTNVFIESAWFDPLVVAAAGRKLGINSDARYRFERTVDPEGVLPGLELATKLVLELCGGTAHEVGGRRPCRGAAAPSSIFRSSEVKRLTGLDLPRGRDRRDA